jgi:TolB-like protein
VFDLLHFLIVNRDRVVSRDEIFQSVWRGRIVSDSVLGNRINAARRAIGDDGTQQRLIRTLRRNGFRFVGTVRETTHRATPYATPLSLPRRRLASVIRNSPGVLVLPFVDGDGGKDREAFAEWLGYEVIAALSDLGWLSVFAGRSWSDAHGMLREPQQIERKLGVRYVLRARMRRADGRLRLITQLVNARGDHVLLSERFEGDVEDASRVRQVADRIASSVGHRIFAAENRRTQLKTPESFTAWESMIRALALINSRRKQNLGAAHALLRRAIAIDPNSAPAHSLLSFVASLSVHMGFRSREPVRAFALHAAQRAVALDAEEPWAHLAVGYARLYTCNQVEEALTHLGCGLRLDPDLAVGHYLLALASIYAGRAADAFAHAADAERSAPRDLLAHGNPGVHDNVRATACFSLGRHDEGVAFARKAILQNPRQVPAYRQVVNNSAFAGDVETARWALQNVTRLSPDVQRFLKESSTMWSRREDFQKMVEAFRIAGLR